MTALTTKTTGAQGVRSARPTVTIMSNIPTLVLNSQIRNLLANRDGHGFSQIQAVKEIPFGNYCRWPDSLPILTKSGGL
jgi:hypothetical protein